MVSEVYMICDAYESGFGKGVQGRIQYRESPFGGSPELTNKLSEAYVIGFDNGYEKYIDSQKCKEKING